MLQLPLGQTAERDRQTDTDRQTDRQTDRHRQREKDRDIDRETETENLNSKTLILKPDSSAMSIWTNQREREESLDR